MPKTEKIQSRSPGRPITAPEKVLSGLPEGTLARIKRVLLKGERRADFVRTAIEAEISKRSR